MIDHHHHHTGRDVADYVLPLLRGGDPPPLRDDEVPLVAEGIRRAGLTALALRRIRPGSAPATLVAALEAERNRLRADLALLYDRLGRLGSLLDAASVRFIVLKGGALAPLLYESAEMRPMVDVDILIRRSDWPAAREAMRGAGYRLPTEKDEAYWLANYFNLAVSSGDPRPAAFDIHWGIGQEVRYRVDEEGLWARAEPYELEGRRLWRLGNEDLLLSLVLHIGYHYFDARLLWLHDIRLLCAKVPIRWDVAIDRARDWGMGAVLGFGLSYVEKVLPGSVPPEVLRRTSAGPIRRLLVAPLRSPARDRFFRGDDRRALQLVQGFLVMEGPGTAVRFAADKIGRRLRFLGARPRLR